MTTKPTTAFIGLGNIGARCARHVVAAGFPTTICDLDPQRGKALVDVGAVWVDSPAEAAAQAQVVVMSLPGPDDVETVLTGPAGVLSTAVQGAVVVDLSTISLRAARRFYDRCRDAGVAYVDSPVSGGVWAAEAANLTLMVGGDAEAFDTVREVLLTFGRDDTVRLGGPGTGTLLKLLNNQIFLVGNQVVQEAYVLASKAGLDPQTFYNTLNSGSAGMFMQLSPMVLNRQWDNSSYDLALAEKDLYLALETARDHATSMPMASAAHQTLLEAIAAGLGDKFFLATTEVFEHRAAHTSPSYDPTAPNNQDGR
ncbi:NAD(P)-dependent oxidoreductase [Mycobacterium sp.]|uniref:NAD(P)-dependent oxidoreductase n=1 Tax=Mycobacterium sp. TaxID=1785 RepID=UPI003BAA304F